MKKAPQHEDAPRLVVAVPSLQPTYALWNAATRKLKHVYGGNTCANSVYTHGIMPKSFRIAAEEENFHHELILRPLPEYIEETVLSESPECTLVITDFRMLEITPVSDAKPACVVRTHPAVFEAKAAHLRKQKPVPGQLFLSPDFQPQTQTA